MTVDSEGRYIPDIQMKSQTVPAINFLQTGQQYAGIGQGQIGQSQQWNQPAFVTIPLAMENWKKLSRGTQVKMLEELGILNSEESRS